MNWIAQGALWLGIVIMVTVACCRVLVLIEEEKHNG